MTPPTLLNNNKVSYVNCASGISVGFVTTVPRRVPYRRTVLLTLHTFSISEDETSSKTILNDERGNNHESYDVASWVQEQQKYSAEASQERAMWHQRFLEFFQGRRGRSAQQCRVAAEDVLRQCEGPLHITYEAAWETLHAQCGADLPPSYTPLRDVASERGVWVQRITDFLAGHSHRGAPKAHLAEELLDHCASRDVLPEELWMALHMIHRAAMDPYELRESWTVRLLKFYERHGRGLCLDAVEHILNVCEEDGAEYAAAWWMLVEVSEGVRCGPTSAHKKHDAWEGVVRTVENFL